MPPEKPVKLPNLAIRIFLYAAFGALCSAGMKLFGPFPNWTTAAIAAPPLALGFGLLYDRSLRHRAWTAEMDSLTPENDPRHP
jgi:hypothetical protein